MESRRACRFDSEESFSTSDLTDNRLDFGKTTPASPQPCVIGEISVRANEYILTKIRNLAVFILFKIEKFLDCFYLHTAEWSEKVILYQSFIFFFKLTF